jgi:hypothetical protein
MAQDRFDRMLHENPLLVGAAALLLSAAPSGWRCRRRIRRTSGWAEARDAVIDRAQQMAGDAAARVQDTASDVADAASKIAESGTNKPSAEKGNRRTMPQGPDVV